MTIDRPMFPPRAEAQDSPVYLPTPVTPEEAFQAIGRLRREARAEIDRLIQFLDTTDDYVSRELEENGDEKDVSYPESGARAYGSPHEDDEDGNDLEPSLGSSGHAEAGAISYMFHPISDGEQFIWDCEADEHDGREPDLGWTNGGAIGGSSDGEITSPEVTV